MLDEQKETVEVDVAEFARQDPSELIRLLKIPDMTYWEAIKNQILKPFLSFGTSYGMKMADKCVDVDDVYSHVFESLILKGALENIRNDECLVSFILSYAKSYINSFYGRRVKTSDGEEWRAPCKIQTISLDAGDSKKECGIDKLPMLSDDEPSDEAFLTYQNTREGFNLLWKKHPKRAVALLLRYVKGLSAREVCEFMDLASENYVNQVVNVAKGDMRRVYLPIEKILIKRRG